MVERSYEEKLRWLSWFRAHFDDWVTRTIESYVDEPDALTGFLWIACAIEWLAGFWYGASTKGKSGEVYRDWLKEYFPPVYDPDLLYDSLRNGLVHSFTIKGKHYGLLYNNSRYHLRKDTNGQTMLNARDFFDDWQTAKEKYFDEVERDAALLDKAFERFARDEFLGPVTSYFDKRA
jgi:hypothetical protein